MIQGRPEICTLPAPLSAWFVWRRPCRSSRTRPRSGHVASPSPRGTRRTDFLSSSLHLHLNCEHVNSPLAVLSVQGLKASKLTLLFLKPCLTTPDSPGHHRSLVTVRSSHPLRRQSQVLRSVGSLFLNVWRTSLCCLVQLVECEDTRKNQRSGST